tara:strand:- start:1038 stop:1433 length:396 start_codon:yes stop_codon:yes gene_type:complete
MVRPQIVAGVNALGRGQDQQSLVTFIQTIAQTMGPEIMAQFLDPGEYIKRLAAAQGIDVLNLVKSLETMEQERQQQIQAQQQQTLLEQAGQLSGAPLADPTKNPALNQTINEGIDQQNAEDQGEPPYTGEE